MSLDDSPHLRLLADRRSTEAILDLVERASVVRWLSVVIDDPNVAAECDRLVEALDAEIEQATDQFDALAEPPV